jgi:hypothetical protein
MSRTLFRLVAISCLAAAAAAQRHGGPVHPGPWNTKEQIAPGWIVYESPNYQVQSECGPEKAKRLADHMEAMNKLYRRMFNPEKEGAKRQTIKLFKTENEFHAYGAPAGAAAYFSADDREMVCYDTNKWMDDKPAVKAPTTGEAADPEDPAAKLKADIMGRLERERDMWKMDLLGCAAHEGWHQYFHWYVGSRIELPSWIDEGMGDYFYTAVPKQAKGRQMPAELGGSNAIRLMTAKKALEHNAFVPAPELIKYNQMQYYANAGICYAEGWALCQFMMHSGNPKYAKVVQTFIRVVRDDTNMPHVTEKAFKGIDLEQLDKDFRAWIKGQPLPEEEKAMHDLFDAKKKADKPDASGGAEPGSGAGEPGGGGG